MKSIPVNSPFLRGFDVKVLAKSCGWSVRETQGAMVDLITIYFDRNTIVLPERDVDTVGGVENFSSHLIDAGMAVRAGRYIRLTCFKKVA